MLTVTRILSVSETVFCIYFLINNLTNKQPPDDDCSYNLKYSVLTLTPTIDKEPKKIKPSLSRRQIFNISW